MSSRSERKNKMKNTIKSLFSLLFALLILLSLIPCSTLAAGKEITSIVLNRDPYSFGTTTDSWLIAEPFFIALPKDADTSAIRLYYADTDEPLKIYDKEKFDDGYIRYTFEESGIYMVYAMDGKTGIRSKPMEFKVYNNGVSEIRPRPDRMPEQTAGVPFKHQYYDQIYNMTVYFIKLYYADTDTPVATNEDSKYIIPEPGEYRVYYREDISGTRSEVFTITVKPADNPQTSDSIYILILFALLSATAAYQVLKLRKYE